MIADAGPLGFAVLVGYGGSRTAVTPAHDVLLFSADGAGWRATDLANEGAPVGGAPIQVTVGADHIAVDYQTPVAGSPMKAVTVLATPQR